MRTERGPTARTGQVGRRSRERSRRRGPRAIGCERLEPRALLAFSPPAVFPVGNSPAAVALADFDNDGRVDIVTADGGAFGVLVDNTPTGGQVATFRPQVAFTTTGAPVALAVGDFNADGKPDVAVATAGAIEVSINQTTGSVASGATLSFSGSTVLNLGGQPTAVAIGDFNGDSKPDIVATSADNKVTVFTSTTGPFATVATFSTAVSTSLLTPQALVIRDLNADGMPDLAVACGGSTAPGSVAILVNTTASAGGPPSFAVGPSLPVGLGPRGIDAGDFNADGRPDLAVANMSSDSVSIVLNATVNAGGTPAFAAQTLVAVGASPRGIAVGEVNGDGVPDIAVANAGSGSVTLLSNGTAPLSTVVDFSARTDLAAGTKPVAVAIGEFNGDSLADLAFADVDTASVGVILQDFVTPTLAIETSATLAFGESTSVTFTFSEPVSGFTNADVQVTGGTLTGFTGSATSYTATFTAGTTVGQAKIVVAAGAYADLAGLAGTVESSATIDVVPGADTTPPTVAITATATTLNAVETATITFTLSEPAGDFTATDVLVTLGTLTGFAQQSALVYTATFTPDAGVAGVAGTASITVPPASFTDTAGNANVGGPSLQIAVNTIAPTIAIATSATTLTAGQTATITFTLSEPADDFAAADVLVGLGTLSGFAQQSATVYTATFTPDVGAAGATAITVVSGQFTNAAGNANVGNQSQPIQIDTRLPTVTIASGASTLAAGEQTTITFTLSEPSPNFTAAAVDVLYGSLSGFAPVAGVTGLVYTATFTADPTLTFYVIGGVEVPAGRFTDQAGNPNVAASGPITITVTYGVPAPTVAIGTTATALKAGQTATISFTLSEPAYDFDAGDVQVTGGTLSGFAGAGASYTATFTPLPDSMQPGTVSVPAGAFHGTGYYVYPYYTSSPNLAAALAPPIQIDTRPPTINVVSSTTNLLVGQTATITFTLSEPAAAFTLATIQATAGTLSGLSGSGTSYTALFTPQPGYLGTGEVKVAAGAFTDVAGNPNLQPAAVSLVIDTQPPTAIAITPIPAGSYKAGTVLAFTVGFSEPVTVEGTPRIQLQIGNALRQALYTGTVDGPGNAAGSRLRFAYTVQPGDNTPVGDRSGPHVAGAIDLAGVSIRDPLGNQILPAIPAVGTADVVVDTIAPTVAVTSSQALLGAGKTALTTFTLSEPSPDFGPASLAAVGGTLSAFAGSGLVYTALFTPQPNLNGTAVVRVDVGRFTDLAGNAAATAAVRSTAVDTALRFAAGTDGQSIAWDREFAYRAATATTIRLPLPVSQAAFFAPKTVLSITPNNATQSIVATVKASRFDTATGSVVVTLDKSVPVTKAAGFGTLVFGGIVPPGARLLAGVSGVVVHDYGAADLLQAGYSPAFVTRFQGGMRTAAADLDDNGFADLIVAPGGVPNLPDPLAPGRRLADAFGNSLRTVAIFDGSPVPAWAPVKLDVGPVLGVATQGGFQVTTGNVVADAAGSATLELIVASGTKLAVYDVRVPAPGARPSINPVPLRVIELGAGQTATGVATGRLFAADPFDNVIVAATTASGRVAGTTTVSILAGAALGVVRSFPVTCRVESGPSRQLTDIFGFGASLAVGDIDGNGANDLVLGAGAGGQGNFRVLANEFLTADPRRPAFAATIATQLGSGGRFAQYRAPVRTWRPSGGPDFFTPGLVTGPTGQGFNAPVSVRVVNVSTTGSARAEVFAALGAANQTANTVKRFLFTGPGAWTSAAAFDLLPSSATDRRFGYGTGVRLG